MENEISPYLIASLKRLELKTVLNRQTILNNELGKSLDEKLVTAYYFKEKSKELAEISGIPPFNIRMAFTEGIQNIIEHGEGEDVEISISANGINEDDSYIEMSFKHFFDSEDFYSLKQADKNADIGFNDFESSRGRGEYMMREIMDERKFINGMEKTDDGKKLFFFKRIMRKYKNPKHKSATQNLTSNFKKYIDSLHDYSSAVFIRMDYINKKKEIVLSELRGHIDKIESIMNSYNYKLKGSDVYKGINFSFWETDIIIDNTNEILEVIFDEFKRIMEDTSK